MLPPISVASLIPPAEPVPTTLMFAALSVARSAALPCVGNGVTPLRKRLFSGGTLFVDDGFELSVAQKGAAQENSVAGTPAEANWLCTSVPRTDSAPGFVASA